MEASVEAAVMIVLGLAIILLGYSIVYPMIEEKTREARYSQAKNVAFEIHEALESAALSGSGFMTTLGVNVPSEVVMRGGSGPWENRSLEIVLYNPPEAVGTMTLARGAVSVLNQSATGNAVLFRIAAVGSWRILVSGLAPSGEQVPVRIENKGNMTISITFGG